MKIGILGGTFDPIHNGHVSMIKTAREILKLDLVFVIPAGNPYFKKGVTPYEIRYQMVQAALSELHDVRYRVSSIESDESKPTYTYQTLEYLQAEYPGAELFFLCGADVLEQLPSWRKPERIAELAVIAAFSRITKDPDADAEEKREQLHLQREHFLEQYPAAECRLMFADIPDISSTMVRTLAREGKSLKDYIAQSVNEIIDEYSLY